MDEILLKRDSLLLYIFILSKNMKISLKILDCFIHLIRFYFNNMLLEFITDYF